MMMKRGRRSIVVAEKRSVEIGIAAWRDAVQSKLVNDLRPIEFNRVEFDPREEAISFAIGVLLGTARDLRTSSPNMVRVLKKQS